MTLKNKFDADAFVVVFVSRASALLDLDLRATSSSKIDSE